MKKKPFVLFIVLFMIGCQLAPSVGLPTETPFPSITPVPSETLVPSQTLSPLPTLTPSVTVRPTFTPTLTSTPQPALVQHKWEPMSILVKYDTEGGGLCNWECPPFPISFILYGDGTLVLSNFVPKGERGYLQLLYKKLPQNEICKLLNTVDQIGFLNLDPESYFGRYITDSSTWIVEVNAWRQNHGAFHALNELVSDLELYSEFPEGLSVPPSVLSTYQLLNNYPLDGFSIYQPETLGVWIWKPTDSYRSIEWKVKRVSLADLYERAGSTFDELSEPVFLHGNDAKDVYSMFENAIYYGEVTDGDEAYQMYVRPLLPFERIEDGVSVISPTSDQLNMPEEMQCYPSDGIMVVPTIASK
jgi:hypothetical protein